MDGRCEYTCMGGQSPNSGWMTSGPLSAFVSKVLLAPSHADSSCGIRGCFCAMTQKVEWL